MAAGPLFQAFSTPKIREIRKNLDFRSFSRVLDPGSGPKRSGTSFSSTLHPSVPQNLFLGPGFDQSLQFVKSVIFPAFFLFLATPPSHLQAMGLESTSSCVSSYPISLSGILKQYFHHRFFCDFLTFVFLNRAYKLKYLLNISKSPIPRIRTA